MGKKFRHWIKYHTVVSRALINSQLQEKKCGDKKPRIIFRQNRSKWIKSFVKYLINVWYFLSGENFTQGNKYGPAIIHLNNGKYVAAKKNYFFEI